MFYRFYLFLVYLWHVEMKFITLHLKAYDLVNLEPGKEIMIPVEEYMKNVSKDNKAHEIIAICIRKAGIEGDTFKGKVFFTYRLLNDAYIG